MCNLKKLHTRLDILLDEIIINKMKTKLSKKRAISTVLTTVIILVSSVVLGSGVVLYGTTLFQGGTQSESISVSGIKVWVHATDPNGIAWGAAGIRNTGDKVVAVDKIQIRGTDIPFTQWYSDNTVTAAVFQRALNHTGWDSNFNPVQSTTPTDCTAGGFTGLIAIDTDTSGPLTDCIQASQATGPISMAPGGSAIVYFHLNNGTLTSLDSGVSTTVNIFAGKAGAPQSVSVIGLT